MLARTAALLGYHEKPEAKPKADLRKPGGSGASAESLRTPLIDDHVERAETPFWRLEAYEALTDETSVDDEEEPTGPVGWRYKPSIQPTHIPLEPWRRLLPKLRRSLALPVETKDIDVDRIVRQLGRGEMLRAVPYRTRRRWCRHLQIITDRSDRLTPFRDDQRDVIARLGKILPGQSVQHGACGADPSDIRLFRPKAPTSDYQMPAAGGVVLVLGDLGWLSHEPGSVVRSWRSLEGRLRDAGCRLIALTPSPPGRRCRDARRYIDWERSLADESAQQDELDERAERLLTLLSPAAQIEPGLLRAVRLLLPADQADAGTEADIWQRSELISRSRQGAVLAPGAARRLRQAFARLADVELKEQVLKTIRAWHADSPDEVWLGEVAGLDARSQRLVPYRDAVDAGRYFGQVRREFGDGFEPGTWNVAWARGFLDTLPDHAWSDDFYRLWWSVGDQDGPAPPGFKPGLIDGSEAPRRRLALDQHVELMARPWSVGDPGADHQGSFLGFVNTRNGYVHVEDVDRFWADGAPPSWARDWGEDSFGRWVTFAVDRPGSDPVIQKMRWIPPGRFMMGSPEDEAERASWEGPQHEVRISQGFWMFDTACTQELWQAVMGENPSEFKGSDRPVENVSFEDVQAFFTKLKERVPDLDLALPTEAQWEYACRAGTETPFSFGPNITTDEVNYHGDFPYADGAKGKYRKQTVPVRSLPANPWGLFEMHGNVWEWCADTWHENYDGAPADGSAWIDGQDTLRVVRGGSWVSLAGFARSAYRLGDEPGRRDASLGFRCAGVQGIATPFGQGRGGEAERPPDPDRRGGASLLRLDQATTVASSAMPKASAFVVRSDAEALTFGRITRPAWASAMGRDQHGLWASFELPSSGVRPVSQKMRWIGPGRFMMGSPEDEAGRYDWEGPRHEVTISKGFWLFDTPCTQALWQTVMGENPSGFQSPKRPVEQVSFEDVQGFLEKLGDRLDGLRLRLPSEAQWEYACRAGTATATYAGDLEIKGERNAPVLDPIAWYGGNSGVGFELDNGFDSSDWKEKQYEDSPSGTHPVGRKLPNSWGLYDMLGNVFEWCADTWHQNYDDAPADGGAWIDDQSTLRVVRGGSWIIYARSARSAFRFRFEPGSRHGNLGFRCAGVQEES